MNQKHLQNIFHMNADENFMIRSVIQNRNEMTISVNMSVNNE